MNDQFSFLQFLKSLIARRKWSYAGGIVSVILLDAVDMLPALIVKDITDQVQKDHQNFDVLPYSFALIGCYFLIALLRMGWRFLLMIPSRHIEQELRQEAYDKLLSSNFIKVSQLKTGDVVSSLSQELSNLRMFMGPGILVFFDSLAYMIFIPITLFYILGTAAAWVLLPFTLLIIVVSIVHQPIEKGFEAISKELGNLSQFVFEETQGVRFFRTEGLVQIRRKKYDYLLNSLLSKQLNVSKWELGLDSTLQLVLQCGYFAVLVLAWQGHSSMAQGLGALTVTIQLLDKLAWPLMSIGYIMDLYQQANNGAKRIHQITSLSEKKEGPIDLSEDIERIELKNLNVFSVDGRKLLSDINLEIKKGEHIALVGTVGSGKTVLLQALAGLWETDQIKFDQFQFNQVSYDKLKRDSLLKIISYIPQTPQIFSRTLGMNISPRKKFNTEEMWNSLEKADLAVDVKRFPEELSTQIGEKGVNLSGGQKQRTLIARSFHSEGKVYLWDDAISALDPATEKKIISTLRTLNKEAILVLATHRLSSLKNFDRIIVLEKGRIVKSGRFEDIRKDHELFRTLSQDEKDSQKPEVP